MKIFTTSFELPINYRILSFKFPREILLQLNNASVTHEYIYSIFGLLASRRFYFISFYFIFSENTSSERVV